LKDFETRHILQSVFKITTLFQNFIIKFISKIIISQKA